MITKCCYPQKKVIITKNPEIGGGQAYHPKKGDKVVGLSPKKGDKVVGVSPKKGNKKNPPAPKVLRRVLGFA